MSNPTPRIVSQDLCEVCAVSLDDVRAAFARLTSGAHVEIVSSNTGNS